MAVLYIVVTIALVAVIGLVSVGRVTARFDEHPAPSLFDIDEAVDYIAERLPDEVTAQLSYDDVLALVGWYVDYLEGKGVAAETEDQLLGEQASGVGPMVADEDEGLAYVLGQATEAGLDADDDHVVAVLEETMAYLTAIGAVGAAVDLPNEPV